MTASPIAMQAQQSRGERERPIHKSSYTRSPMLYAQQEERLNEGLMSHEDDLRLDAIPAPLNLDEIDDDSDEHHEEGAEFVGEDIHIEGVPRSTLRLDARRYTTASYAASLLVLLRDDLDLDGWSALPDDTPSSWLSIHKVSGALTNAVFFVSCPKAQNPPPTVLVRVYGPSSGSLILRKVELHLLHNLSSSYGIGPAVLGTFENGRVEEFFKSRALHKEEIREPKISRWIARRMKELHGVPREVLQPPPEKTVDSSGNDTAALRPKLAGRNSSTASLASNTSAFSFGSSYSSDSGRSSSMNSNATSRQNSFSGASGGMEFALGAAADFSESRAPQKKRSRSSRGSFNYLPPTPGSASPLVKSGVKQKDKLGVWDNVTRSTREAGRILHMVEKLRSLPGVDATTVKTLASPMESPSAMLAFKDQFDLARFEHEIKAYRGWLKNWEKQNGKSKRCLSHNDAQYGNLLIRLVNDEQKHLDAGKLEVERGLQAPHQMIIVVDFEYASVNPRGFDLANHFVEWQADYHSLEHSFSLSAHLSYPDAIERRTFYKAYTGIDGGRNSDEHEPDVADPSQEDTRVLRLEEEVRVWQPATHAAWLNWAVVQARDDILSRVEEWLEKPKVVARAEKEAHEEKKRPDHEPTLRRTKSGELVSTLTGDMVNQESAPEGDEAEFDYLLYGIERMQMFRKEIAALGVEV